ncbi:MAG: TraB/GumN family protein [Desulfuromonadaceae bacterium]|nr:TraB/GumN family protein [Desulfuromonas sp.]MDY0184730.1 TraB/GumN family protein [Desulfuromonadaceae bacterium]
MRHETSCTEQTNLEQVQNQQTAAEQDLHRINMAGREIILIGTAHISRESVDTVIRTIENEHPHSVCVELDEQRYRHLTDKNRWENLNIVQVIKGGQIPFLMANLALASFQRRMGLHTGVKPGEELAVAAQKASEMNMNLVLVDRSIRITLLRAWRKTGFLRKMQLISTMFAGLFEKQELDEEELSKIRQTDTLSAMLEEMAEVLPQAKTTLVDERDRWMAHHIAAAPGAKIIAVVGAAHVPGIIGHLNAGAPIDITGLDVIPEKPRYSKIVPWIIPLVVAVLFVGGFFFADRSQLYDAATAWILANGILAAIGAALALGHPLTIVSAFIAAPITSLNPTIGAGFVTALVQAYCTPPTVADMEKVADDVVNLRGWWHNRMTRIVLVFFFSSLGSTIGTFVAFGWFKNIF